MVLGLGAVRDWDTAVVLPVDSALVSMETVKTLVERYQGGSLQVVKPVSQGRGGHPMVVDPALVMDNASLVRSKGLRAVQYLPGVRVDRVDVDDPLCVKDIDTFEDFWDLCFRRHGR